MYFEGKMKCLFVFLMTLGMAMSFPQARRDAAMDPEEGDPKELETMPQGKASRLLKVADFIVLLK